MRLDVTFRCTRWANCTTRRHFGLTRCIWGGRFCDGLIAEIREHGREEDFDANVFSTSKYSKVITIPARICKKLQLETGDEVHVILQKVTEEDRIARTVSKG